MGKVLRKFINGYPGAVSRSVDNIIISVRNAADTAIPFGTPVFLVPGDRACRLFETDVTSPETFLGVAVRAADKTPETYGSNQAAYEAGDPVDVLVRGSTVLVMESSAAPGSGVYIRKADGKVVASAGAEGTTVQLLGVTVRTARDSARCSEVVLTRRNIM